MASRALAVSLVVLVRVLLVALFVVQVPAVQGGIVGGLVGLLSSQATVYIQRLLRERGEVRCFVRAWSNATTGGERELRAFEMRFFNEKDVSIALWDVKVEFHKNDESPITVFPLGGAYGTPGYGARFSSLNLPSRVAVDYPMYMEVGEENLQKLKDSERVEFVGTIPGGEVFRKELPSWQELRPPDDPGRREELEAERSKGFWRRLFGG